jgi:predicted RNase H-like nuclease (RuvC/YqgF family)
MASPFHGKRHALILTKNGKAIIWAIFSQTRLVTLLESTTFLISGFDQISTFFSTKTELVSIVMFS